MVVVMKNADISLRRLFRYRIISIMCNTIILFTITLNEIVAHNDTIWKISIKNKKPQDYA